MFPTEKAVKLSSKCKYGCKSEYGTTYQSNFVSDVEHKRYLVLVLVLYGVLGLFRKADRGNKCSDAKMKSLRLLLTITVIVNEFIILLISWLNALSIKCYTPTTQGNVFTYQQSKIQRYSVNCQETHQILTFEEKKDKMIIIPINVFDRLRDELCFISNTFFHKLS